jgi:hypothetical protein
LIVTCGELPIAPAVLFDQPSRALIVIDAPTLESDPPSTEAIATAIEEAAPRLVVVLGHQACVPGEDETDERDGLDPALKLLRDDSVRHVIRRRMESIAVRLRRRVEDGELWITGARLGSAFAPIELVH